MILNKKIAEHRYCLWCNESIDHIHPRNKKFCNKWHKDLYNAKRKREWYFEKKNDKTKT